MMTVAALVLAAAAVVEFDGPVAAVKELTAANGVGSTLESLAFFAGPAIAGFLPAVADVATVCTLNAATFLLSAVLVLGIKVARTPGTTDPDPSADRTDGTETKPNFLAEAMEGFRVIWRSRDLRLVMAIYCAQTVVAGASLVFVRCRLHRHGHHRAANPIGDVNAATVIQRITPDAVLGRVFGALEGVLIPTMALGALAMPLLIAGPVGVTPLSGDVPGPPAEHDGAGSCHSRNRQRAARTRAGRLPGGDVR